MSCYNPLTAYKCREGGKLAFNERAAQRAGRDVLSTTQIPCGQCFGCRLDKSKDWAIRCMHEAQMHDNNCFLTLTLNDENLPSDMSLDHRTFQLFLKKLRQSASRARIDATHGIRLDAKYRLWYANAKPLRSSAPKPVPIRYYMAGEYGEEHSRPHYHACLFGIDFNDKIYHRTTEAGYKVYKSETLTNIWGNGYASIGALTLESAAYVARYVMKKRTGNENQKQDQIINLETGEIILRKKTYNEMSRGQGIGKSWLEKYSTDVYPLGKVHTRTAIKNAPRYYDNIWKELHPEQWEEIQYGRHIEAIAHYENQTPERLRARETVAKAAAKFLHRKGNFT